MAEIADEFGGKVNGELIRAADWNGLIDAIEARFAAMETALGARIDANTTRIAALEALVPRVTSLETLANTIRDRFRQMDLSTARASFAVGERAEIVARITSFEGAALNLANAATRPWVDFVTVWGSLKAAPGFVSRAGTGDKTVSVQVNADGEARALLREATAEALGEEQELEVSSVLDTMVGTTSIAQQFLAASNPQATNLTDAWQVVSNAYQRNDTFVMRNYLDGIYLRNPSLSRKDIAPVFTLNWRDTYATVLAFAKLDDNSSTADGSVAVGSIRVTFRDWVYPWLYTQFLPPSEAAVNGYVGLFNPIINIGLENAYNGIFDLIEERTLPLGLLGQQREYIAAKEAMGRLPSGGRPVYFDGLVEAVQGGLGVQQALGYSYAVTPGLAIFEMPGKAVGQGAVKGEAAADRVVEVLREETNRNIAQSEMRVIDQVKAENTQFENMLMRDDGPVMRAQTIALDAASKADQASLELGRKAGIELVSQLLAAQERG